MINIEIYTHIYIIREKKKIKIGIFDCYYYYYYNWY